jgi:hypothetical protein
MMEEFVKLGWWLLEQKAIYYLGFGDGDVHPSWAMHYGVEDAEYDKKERRYEALAFRLGLDPTVSNMVGFDKKRPCCQLVLSKLSKPIPARLKPENRAATIFG